MQQARGAVTQTNRFKAAVAAAGGSDWLSYYGENGIDGWMLPYFGASVYARGQRAAQPMLAGRCWMRSGAWVGMGTILARPISS